MQPAFPMLVFGQTPQESLWIAKVPEKMQTVSLLVLQRSKPGKEVFFDSANRVWHRQVEAVKPLGVVTKLLAYTFYNPKSIVVRSEWLLQRNFTLPELKNRVKACVEADDDVLTQFSDAEALNTLLDKASSFEEVVRILTKPFDEEYH
ncbi:hypothetical protein E5K00_20920 [Hymenobacter aquaticus]|uniref:Uncharacterized protein n=1 Tax=Hymenobacter aquaticus TaxID=1867101 RepID=A0A4Z0PVL4_9BACT|nr:hypothetical protein [Hymenobacter aquaticus]TGE20462.1 hypothetical protein E5K00_20920 [Hymenobacter aquaticus]